MKMNFHHMENFFSLYGKFIFMPRKSVSYATNTAINWIKRIRNTIAIG